MEGKRHCILLETVGLWTIEGSPPSYLSLFLSASDCHNQAPLFLKYQRM